MPPWGPVKRTQLIRNLHLFGFDGPFSGGKHQFMSKGELTVRIPNPHEGDVGIELLSRILRQSDITRKDWENL